MFEKNDSTGLWFETAKLIASDGTAGDQFGFSVSVWGDLAIVGAHHDDDDGDRSGSAYVFQKDDSTGVWHEIDKLTASDGETGDIFGTSVSVSGTTILVGALNDDTENGVDSGSAYVFESAQKP